jgi:hypothetical protein
MKSTIGKFIKRFLLLDLVLTVVLMAISVPGTHDGTPVTTAAKITYTPGVVCAAILLVSLFLFFVYAFFAFANRTGNALHRAVQPVPSPAEIYVRIQHETGKEPSIADVAAIHQMLTAERNEAAVQAGIGVGGLALAWKLSHR